MSLIHIEMGISDRNKIDFPPELADFLADENVKKIGLALRDDFNGLIKQRNFKPTNFIDLQSIVKSYGLLELGLQKISAIIFHAKISKSQRLTNWENPEPVSYTHLDVYKRQT